MSLAVKPAMAAQRCQAPAGSALFGGWAAISCDAGKKAGLCDGAMSGPGAQRWLWVAVTGWVGWGWQFSAVGIPMERRGQERDYDLAWIRYKQGYTCIQGKF